MYKEGQALPDKNDDTTASVRVIGRNNTRAGVSAIRSQSKESRDHERGRQVNVGFVDKEKLHR